MHPRQRSKCVTVSPKARPSRRSPSSISTIRPRGESASQPTARMWAPRPGRTRSARSRRPADCSGGLRCASNSRPPQIPPTNTPGLQAPAGSKRALIRRISSSAGPSPRPTRRADCRSSRGASSSTAPLPTAARDGSASTASGSSSTSSCRAQLDPTTVPPHACARLEDGGELGGAARPRARSPAGVSAGRLAGAPTAGSRLRRFDVLEARRAHHLGGALRARSCLGARDRARIPP